MNVQYKLNEMKKLDTVLTDTYENLQDNAEMTEKETVIAIVLRAIDHYSPELVIDGIKTYMFATGIAKIDIAACET